MSKILPKFIKIEPLIALGLSALLLIFAYVLKSTPETLTYTFRNGVIQKHSDHEFFQVIAGLTILLVVWSQALWQGDKRTINPIIPNTIRFQTVSTAL